MPAGGLPCFPFTMRHVEMRSGTPMRSSGGLNAPAACVTYLLTAEG